jgi:hypothetical protein
VCPENAPYSERSPSNVLIRRPFFQLCPISYRGSCGMCLCVCSSMPGGGMLAPAHPYAFFHPG